MSGSWIISRQRATRRFSPPESTPTFLSGGGQRRASMASSSSFSNSHPFAASIFSCSWACFSRAFPFHRASLAHLVATASYSCSIRHEFLLALFDDFFHGLVRIELRFLFKQSDGVALRRVISPDSSDRPRQ